MTESETLTKSDGNDISGLIHISLQNRNVSKLTIKLLFLCKTLVLIYYMLHMYISCYLIMNVALKSSVNLKSDLKKLFLSFLCYWFMPEGL